MNFDDDDFDDDFDEEAYEREQQEEEERLQNHPLFKQANEVMNIIDVLIDTANDIEKIEPYALLLRESAMVVVAKLAGALPSKSYVVCMQNAAIIREHAEILRLSNHMLTYAEVFDIKYIEMFRAEMETFRHLFKSWAAEIHQMEPDFQDEEWGLFLK